LIGVTIFFEYESLRGPHGDGPVKPSHDGIKNEKLNEDLLNGDSASG
jgi:hypothetical protein